MKRNTISLYDFKLRFFVDTNVLIDYIENFNEKKCVTFLNLFRKSKVKKKAKIEEVELVTSDYVLWEFKGRIRRELHAKKLVKNHGFSIIAANSESNKFRKEYANIKCMKNYGQEISNIEKQIFDEMQLLYLERLMGKALPGISETIDKILSCSKLPYKDAIVLASAIFTKSNFILTCDEQHFNNEIFNELKEAMKEWQKIVAKPIDFKQIEIKRPSSYPSLKVLRQEYKKWFMCNNEQKIIGTAVKFFPRLSVVEIMCKRKNYLKAGDQGWLVRFNNDGKMTKLGFSINESNLRSFKTKKPTKKGKHVTIKLERQNREWDQAHVFLAE
ncbi:MAG: PIN domain-containing protein [Candidatus Omnitrophica bacterium]|jgi:predicted nucleic acid-binding protein|nr:PIN domain-containing protein [Candidatus Omnitrophota bacterium]